MSSASSGSAASAVPFGSAEWPGSRSTSPWFGLQETQFHQCRLMDLDDCSPSSGPRIVVSPINLRMEVFSFAASQSDSQWVQHGSAYTTQRGCQCSWLLSGMACSQSWQTVVCKEGSLKVWGSGPRVNNFSVTLVQQAFLYIVSRAVFLNRPIRKRRLPKHLMIIGASATGPSLSMQITGFFSVYGIMMLPYKAGWDYCMYEGQVNGITE